MKKKLFLGILTLSTLSFAWGGSYNLCCSNNGYMRGHNYSQNSQLTQEQQQLLTNYQIQISEKQLEITKIRNSTNIDWNQIEKLNQEISEISIKLNTERMKYNMM